MRLIVLFVLLLLFKRPQLGRFLVVLLHFSVFFFLAHLLIHSFFVVLNFYQRLVRDRASELLTELEILPGCPLINKPIEKLLSELNMSHESLIKIRRRINDGMYKIFFQNFCVYAPIVTFIWFDYYISLSIL